MQFPENLLYAESHEWVKQEGNQVTIGITDFAQGQLKDIVYVELPEIGAEVKKGESVGGVESVRPSPISPRHRKVVETNSPQNSLGSSTKMLREDGSSKEIKDKGELKDFLLLKPINSSCLSLIEKEQSCLSAPTVSANTGTAVTGVEVAKEE
jgi:glycine cleavage system H protein